MKNQLKLTAFTLCFSLGIFHEASAQQTINVAGNSAVIHGMTFDYSIGEMTVISTEKTANLIVTQGLLQPLPSATNSSNTTSPDNHLSTLAGLINVYPNPTSNVLYIETKDQQAGDLNYQLFDASGKLVASSKELQKEGSNKFSFNLQSFASGSYFLMIQKSTQGGNVEAISFKIQKTN